MSEARADETTQHESSVELTEIEESTIQEQLPHRAPVLFEILRRSGQEELERPLLSLWSSGLVAGLSIGFSVLTPAMLRRLLPEAEWAHLIAQIGYSVGFVIVVLSRQQLFTENVITAVVPVMAEKKLRNLILMLRLWAIVLVANIVGAALFAAFLHYSGVLDDSLAKALHDVCAHLIEAAPGGMTARAMVSGFLIAGLVWILAGFEGSGLSIIILMTSLIGIGSFSHVVAGTVEAAYLVFTGDLTVARAITGFFLPTLAGNLIGGTAIFTLLSYGQIHGEMREGGTAKGGRKDAGDDRHGHEGRDGRDGRGSDPSRKRPAAR